jgi:hypothetical protein
VLGEIKPDEFAFAFTHSGFEHEPFIIEDAFGVLEPLARFLQVAQSPRTGNRVGEFTDGRMTHKMIESPNPKIPGQIVGLRFHSESECLRWQKTA